MPLQNRVDPFGSLIRSAARGTMMGNRGPCLHNERRELVRYFRGTRWIICLLEFKGRQRRVMSPGLYTELFFLDEAVALAAGHRPCCECQRDRFDAFKDAWAGHAEAGRKLRAPEIDAALHGARIDSRGKKVTYRAAMESLPSGCFVELDGDAYLVRGDSILLWTAGGYIRRDSRPEALEVTVLTPEPTVRCLQRGYIAGVHESGRENS